MDADIQVYLKLKLIHTHIVVISFLLGCKSFIGKVQEDCVFFCRVVRGSAMIFLSLVLSEVSVIRLLTKLVWKRIPRINPDPFATFLFLWNTLVSLLLGSLTNFSTPGKKIELTLLGGNPELVILPSLDLR